MRMTRDSWFVFCSKLWTPVFFHERVDCPKKWAPGRSLAQTSIWRSWCDFGKSQPNVVAIWHKYVVCRCQNQFSTFVRHAVLAWWPLSLADEVIGWFLGIVSQDHGYHHSCWVVPGVDKIHTIVRDYALDTGQPDGRTISATLNGNHDRSYMSSRIWFSQIIFLRQHIVKKSGKRHAAWTHACPQQDEPIFCLHYCQQDDIIIIIIQGLKGQSYEQTGTSCRDLDLIRSILLYEHNCNVSGPIISDDTPWNSVALCLLQTKWLSAPNKILHVSLHVEIRGLVSYPWQRSHVCIISSTSIYPARPLYEGVNEPQ